MSYSFGQSAHWPTPDGSLHKGADPGPALAQQAAAQKQSAQQFQIQMAYMQQQAKAAAAVQPATYLPPAPPQTVDQNTLDQQRDVARMQSRRFSFQSTNLPGAGAPASATTLGAPTTLGGGQ